MTSHRYPTDQDHRATRPGARAGAPAVTVGIAVLALAGTLTQLAHGGIAPAQDDPGRVDPTGIVLAVCGTAPLVVWRRWPLAVVVATTAANALLAGLGYPVELVLGPAAAIFLLAAGRRPDAPWTVRTTAAVVGVLGAYLVAAAVARAAFPGIELLHTGLAAAGAWFAGERTRLRREQTAALAERAHRAEHEAERERLLAVAEERARIARDLHDSAGHTISVIAVRAGAARLRHPHDPDRALLALEAVEELARHTVAELDQFVGTLRDGPNNGAGVTVIVDAPPGLASLDTLIAHHETTGLTVTVDHASTPRPLGDAADRAAYRILQEALTNAARHGDGNVRITLAFCDDAVDLTVTNPTAVTRPRPGGGHGLIGMRERATLLGGSLDTDRENGVFRVRARIPYGPSR